MKKFPRLSTSFSSIKAARSRLTESLTPRQNRDPNSGALGYKAVKNSAKTPGFLEIYLPALSSGGEWQNKNKSSANCKGDKITAHTANSSSSESRELWLDNERKKIVLESLISKCVEWLLPADGNLGPKLMSFCPISRYDVTIVWFLMRKQAWLLDYSCITFVISNKLESSREIYVCWLWSHWGKRFAHNNKHRALHVTTSPNSMNFLSSSLR